jgi:hypothetical protein
MPPRSPEQISREDGRVLKRGPQNVAEIRDWLHAVAGKLRDAANADNTEGTRMDAAYDVILY